ncbi:MAG TPA: FAD-dependent oxidoreductase, partial [Longimicrobiaceae bacterium]|nr:FAD-dependent oxidoreductase [Longimicrobiaceae bacterium]
VYQMFTVQLAAGERDRVLRALWARGVGASVHFDPPVHLQPFYRGRAAPGALPATERLAREILSLPIFPDLAHSQQDEVVAALAGALAEGAHRRARVRVPAVRGRTPEETVVLGAGLAGLGAAHRLREEGLPFRVLEAAPVPGGLARTHEVDGFCFDGAGHFLHLSDAEPAARLVPASVPLEWIERRSAVLVGDTLVPYPFQFNLWALDEAFRARALAELARAEPPAHPERASLAEAFRGAWGEAMTEAFLRPYNEKMWGRSLESLPADCLGPFPPAPDPALVRAGCVGPITGQGYNAVFRYPASGRLTGWVDAVAAPARGRLRTGFRVARIDLAARTVEGEDGETVPFARLVSTLALPALLRACGMAAPPGDLLAAAAVRNVQVGLRGRVRTDLHWIYLPDPALAAHRVTFPANVNPRTCPPECTSLSIELGGSAGAAAESAARAVMERLQGLGLLEVDEVLLVREVVIDPAYVVHRAPGREAFRDLREALARHGVATAGRFGSWDYLSMEGAFRSGWQAAAPVPA